MRKKCVATSEEHQISVSQFMILLFGALFAPVVELLLTISSGGGRGGFLSPLVALPFLLLSGYVICALSGEGKGYIQGITGSFCPISGKIVLSFYLLWGVLLLALRLQLGAESFSSVGYKEGSQYFLLPLLAIFVAWMTGIGLSGFARGATLFFGALLTLFLVVLLLSTKDVALVRVLPFSIGELSGIGRSSLGVLGIFSYLIYGSFFLGDVAWTTDKEKNGRFWICWAVAVCLLLSFYLFVGAGVFGANLLADLEQPFYQLAKGVRVQGAFQRMEVFVTASWLLGEFILMGLLLRGCTMLAAEIFPSHGNNHKVVVVIILVISGYIALFYEELQEYSGNLILVGNLILGGTLPFGLFFVKKVLHFPKERGTIDTL